MDVDETADITGLVANNEDSTNDMDNSSCIINPAAETDELSFTMRSLDSTMRLHMEVLMKSREWFANRSRSLPCSHQQQQQSHHHPHHHHHPQQQPLQRKWSESHDDNNRNKIQRLASTTSGHEGQGEEEEEIEEIVRNKKVGKHAIGFCFASPETGLLRFA